MYRTCSHGRVMCQGAVQHRAHLLSPSEGEVSLCNSHKLPFRVRVRHWMPRCRPTVFLRNNYRKDYTWKLLLVKTDKSNKSRVVLRAHGTHLWMSTRHRGIVPVTQCDPLVVRVIKSNEIPEASSWRARWEKRVQNELKTWEDFSSLNIAGVNFFEQGLYTCPQDPGSTDQPGRHLGEKWVVRAGWLTGSSHWKYSLPRQATPEAGGPLRWLTVKRGEEGALKTFILL